MALLIVLLLILAAWQVSGQRQRIRELEDRLRRLEGWAAAADAAKEAERLAARPLPPPAWRVLCWAAWPQGLTRTAPAAAYL